MAPDTPVWQPAILTRPQRNMAISRLWMNFQCTELHPGLRKIPQRNDPAPATPIVFEPWLIAFSESRASALTYSVKRVRLAGKKLAGRLDCHTLINAVECLMFHNITLMSHMVMVSRIARYCITFFQQHFNKNKEYNKVLHYRNVYEKDPVFSYT